MLNDLGTNLYLAPGANSGQMTTIDNDTINNRNAHTIFFNPSANNYEIIEEEENASVSGG